VPVDEFQARDPDGWLPGGAPSPSADVTPARQPVAPARQKELLRAAREDVNSLQFFVSAMASELTKLHDKLAQVEITGGEGEFMARLGEVEADRIAAVHEATALKQQLADAEVTIATLQQDVERQRVTFADHHAAKQEIARLRAELDALHEGESDDKKSSRLFRRT
jgi:TolA-binding protein